MLSFLPKFRESLRADAWLLAWPTSALVLLAFLIALCLLLFLLEDVNPLNTRASSGILLGGLLVWENGSWLGAVSSMVGIAAVDFARRRIEGSSGVVIASLLLAVAYAPLKIWSWFGEPFTGPFDNDDRGSGPAGGAPVAEGAKVL